MHDELNVFEGIWRNKLFLYILVAQAGVQALIVEFGDQAFKVKPLTWVQWLACVARSLSS